MANPKEKLKDVVLNVQMEEYIKAMLRKLCQDSGKGMSQMVRDMIEARYRARFNNEPTCVDCTACRCPQMHAIQPTEKVPGHELLSQHENPSG